MIAISAIVFIISSSQYLRIFLLANGNICDLSLMNKTKYLPFKEISSENFPWWNTFCVIKIRRFENSSYIYIVYKITNKTCSQRDGPATIIVAGP